MIETTTTNKQTNPKIICSAVHLFRKNYCKRKLKKKMPVRVWKIDYTYFLEVCRIFYRKNAT